MNRRHDYSIPFISIPVRLEMGLVILHPRSLLRREIHIRVISPLELISKDIKVLQRLLSRQILHLLRRRIKIDRIRCALAIVSITPSSALVLGWIDCTHKGTYRCSQTIPRPLNSRRYWLKKEVSRVMYPKYAEPSSASPVSNAGLVVSTGGGYCKTTTVGGYTNQRQGHQARSIDQLPNTYS